MDDSQRIFITYLMTKRLDMQQHFQWFVALTKMMVVIIGLGQSYIAWEEPGVVD